MAGLMAALLLAPLGPAPAAAAPACPDDPAPLVRFEAGETTPYGGEVVGGVVTETDPLGADDTIQASTAPAGDVCADGCVACGHCQSHHTAIGAPAGPAAAPPRFALPERRAHSGAAAPPSHLTDRLKRPPRA
ncbi:hypothetical protein [Phenylobacterium sp.]|uniref:hypothetical protein n=1 Tax=Phenylobacterium sp. TaxID=1871053 RepID=UPI00301C82D7